MRQVLLYRPSGAEAGPLVRVARTLEVSVHFSAAGTPESIASIPQDLAGSGNWTMEPAAWANWWGSEVPLAGSAAGQRGTVA